MPQRQRPRLKRYTITCAWCGTQAVKLLPSRRAVLSKTSPFNFCSSEHQRLHWEKRRRESWTATLYDCRQCGRQFESVQRPGRPSIYCSAKCRTVAAMDRKRRDPAADVLSAHNEVIASWSRALRSAHQLVKIYEPVQRVTKAYADAAAISVEVDSEEQRHARQRIQDRLFSLACPKMDPAEPDRVSSRWWVWWAWWRGYAGKYEQIHTDHVVWLRRAAAELRRAERVIARRAETARLRRHRQSDVS